MTRLLSADPKRVELVRGVVPVGVHITDTGRARPLVYGIEQFFEGASRSLGLQPHRPVLLIAHPAGKFELAGPHLGEIPKADALHTTGDLSRKTFLGIRFHEYGVYILLRDDAYT